MMNYKKEYENLKFDLDGYMRLANEQAAEIIHLQAVIKGDEASQKEQVKAVDEPRAVEDLKLMLDQLEDDEVDASIKETYINVIGYIRRLQAQLTNAKPSTLTPTETYQLHEIFNSIEECPPMLETDSFIVKWVKQMALLINAKPATNDSVDAKRLDFLQLHFDSALTRENIDKAMINTASNQG